MSGLHGLVSLAGVLVCLLGMLMNRLGIALLVMLGGRVMRLGGGVCLALALWALSTAISAADGEPG